MVMLLNLKYKKIKIIIGILVIGTILISGLVSLRLFNFSKPTELSLSKTKTQIDIPKVLLEFTNDVIPSDYSLKSYSFQEDETKYEFYFVSKKVKNLYPTIILHKNKVMKKFTSSQNLIKEFDINNYHFLKLHNPIPGSELFFQSQCVTELDGGVLSIIGDNYMWGEFSDCEQFLQKVLTDDYIYPGPLDFNEAQALYLKLSNSFRDCNRTFVVLSSIESNPAEEVMSIDFICNNEKVRIRFIVLQEHTEKGDCCLKMDYDPGFVGSLDKIRNYEVCTSNRPEVAHWTGEKFRYDSIVITENYHIEILSNFKLAFIEKILSVLNSKDVGFNSLKMCSFGNI